MCGKKKRSVRSVSQESETVLGRVPRGKTPAGPGVPRRGAACRVQRVPEMKIPSVIKPQEPQRTGIAKRYPEQDLQRSSGGADQGLQADNPPEDYAEQSTEDF